MELSTDPNYLTDLTKNCIDEHDNLDKDDFKGASDEDSKVKVFENPHQVSMSWSQHVFNHIDPKSLY
ncbi:hypothetical protein EMPG_12632, partial [Blastomyces silverae]